MTDAGDRWSHGGGGSLRPWLTALSAVATVIVVRRLPLIPPMVQLPVLGQLPGDLWLAFVVLGVGLTWPVLGARRCATRVPVSGVLRGALLGGAAALPVLMWVAGDVASVAHGILPAGLGLLLALRLATQGRGWLATVYSMAHFLAVVALAAFLAGGHRQPEAVASSEIGLQYVEVDAAGPLDAVTVRYEGRLPTTLQGPLLPGESAILAGWLDAPRDPELRALAVPAASRVGHEGGPPNVRPVALGDRVMDGEAREILARRPVPPDPRRGNGDPGGEGTPTRPLLVVLITLGLSAVLGRAASMGATLLAVAVALGGAWLASAQGPLRGAVGSSQGIIDGPEAHGRVVDGLFLGTGADLWIVRDIFYGGDLRAGRDPGGELVVQPGAGSPGLIEAGGPGQPTRLWLGHDARMVLTRSFDPGLRRISPEINFWGGIGAVWSRSEGGEWTYRGAWPYAEPLPGPLPAVSASDGPAGPPSVPGWLIAGLPAGGSAYVGHLDPGAFQGPGAPWGAPDQGAWFRIVDR